MASPRQSIALHPRRRSSRLRRGVALLATAVVMSACATGQRPSFDADQPLVEATGDAAVDAVLDRLDAVRTARFTAGYTVLTRLGGIESTATVVQADDSRRSITINDIRFLDGPGNAATCDLTTDECEAVINDARVSDVQLTHDFYASGPARRLRVDEARKLAPATGYEATIADRTATCADVAVSGGTKTYCALDTGVLAKYDGNDLLIELASFSDVPDETRFETS